MSIQGFLIAYFAPQFQGGPDQLAAWPQEGKLEYTETILNGFDKFPEAFIGLFQDQNELRNNIEWPAMK